MTSPADLAVGTGAVLEPDRPAVGPGRAGRGRRVASLPGTRVQVVLLAALAVLARMPLVAAPLTPDEGGFLMVAGQWSPGTSLYGSYWVDRPPLIIGLFQLADLGGGGTVALHVLGAAAVAVAVLLAGRLGHLVGLLARVADPGRPARYAAAAAAVLLVTPLFGATEVDGELLAVPFALAGIAGVLEAHRSSGGVSRAWWAGAGVAAVAAASVKQDMLEVFVAAAVVLVATGRRSRRGALLAGAAFAAGAVAALAVLLTWAARHGTTPVALWDAVVTFRSEASAVIARSAPGTAQARAIGVIGAFVSSGAAALAGLAALRVVRARGAARLPAVLAAAVLVWELFAAAAGGSYWLHYLVGTVPGLVLAAAVCGAGGRVVRRLGAAVLGYAAIVAVCAIAVTIAATMPDRSSDLAIEEYLAAHAAPHDTGTVAFGDPALLQAAHLSSPYPELWSLPVRVRDPELADFTRVLTGADRPTWVVVDGTGLATWGVDATRAQAVLDREYRLAHVAGDWHVYRLRTAYR